MGLKPSDLADDDLLYGYVGEYLDGDISSDLSDRYESLLKGKGGKDFAEQFQKVRGRIQLALQSYYMKENERTKLHGLVQDPALIATQEAIKIEQLERRVAQNNIRRRLVLTVIALLAVGSVVWYFAPKPKTSFDALTYLGYEAAAMESELSPEARLDLPSRDHNEIHQYLSSYPGLRFKPVSMKKLGKGWRPDGATVIDYEIAKVAAVQYGNDQLKEKLFNFSYLGKISDLPKSESGNYRGLIYQTYSSDRLNVIVWQHGKDVIGMLVGHRSAPELAELAQAGIAKK